MNQRSLFHAGLLIVAFATSSAVAGEIGGSLTASTKWLAADSPHLIKSSLIVEKGVTLTIEPGTTVHLAAGADLVVTNGGRLIAEGTADQRIRFSRPPGVRKRWGGIIIMGGPDSPETRIVNAHIEGNAFTAIFSKHGTL